MNLSDEEVSVATSHFGVCNVDHVLCEEQRLYFNVLARKLFCFLDIRWCGLLTFTFNMQTDTTDNLKYIVVVEVHVVE